MGQTKQYLVKKQTKPRSTRCPDTLYLLWEAAHDDLLLRGCFGVFPLPTEFELAARFRQTRSVTTKAAVVESLGVEENVVLGNLVINSFMIQIASQSEERGLSRFSHA